MYSVINDDQSVLTQLHDSILKIWSIMAAIFFASVGFALYNPASIAKSALRHPGTWSDEDAILLATNLLQRDINA